MKYYILVFVAFCVLSSYTFSQEAKMIVKYKNLQEFEYNVANVQKMNFIPATSVNQNDTENDNTSSYPNPFSTNVNIEFEVKSNEHVLIKIYNSNSEIVNQIDLGKLTTGTSSYQWNGKDQNGKSLSSGVYYYEIVKGSSVSGKSMIKIN